MKNIKICIAFSLIVNFFVKELSQKKTENFLSKILKDERPFLAWVVGNQLC